VQVVDEHIVVLAQTTPPGHALESAAPGLHVPDPSQLAGVTVMVLPLQEVVPVHVFPFAPKAHFRAPSQRPVAPHSVEPAAHSLSGSVPVVTGAQVPLALPVLVARQDSQVPLQSASQQTPSTLEQAPLAHWAVDEHLSPGFNLGAQMLVAVLQ
jgi:hypothetical protein